MLNSPFFIRNSARIFSGICLLASLGLCATTPEGALFLFVTGCSWLVLACLAQNSGNQDLDRIV